MSKTILLSDDDQGFRTSVKSILELEDFQVLEAENGVEALVILKSNSVDLLLTDVLMPDMEGIELSYKVGQLMPDLKVIGMTGGGRLSKDSVNNSAKNFFASFLIKPFSREQLLSEINKLLA